MNRIFTIQSRLLKEIALLEKQKIDRDYPLDWERIHLSSCAKIGQLLALKRNIDPEMASIACSLHDFGRIITGKQAAHAPAGYQPLKTFLTANKDLALTPSEIEVLAQTAKNHSNKKDVGTPLEEIVKDADVLDCYQYGQQLERQEQRDRLKKLLAELSLN